MNNGTKKKGAPFKVQWERHVLRVAKLKNPTHALVGMAYIGYANPDGSNLRPPAMKRIAADLGLSERTVERAFEGLEAAGLIVRLSRGIPSKASHWRFVIPAEDPTTLTETPDSGDRKNRQPCQEDPTAVTAYQDKYQHTTNTTTNTEAALTGRINVDDVWAQVEAEHYEREHYEELSTRHLLERFELGAPVGAL
ncbi:helix-turn-helix domain-containing protein [Streptomyces sp. enrichment culture]|uniref:helix-turn-helix domain-containing protein n=1 Tax=Streptomyces sp. enrichment culture TaxID=1795815 RepID=UPI003F56434B